MTDFISNGLSQSTFICEETLSSEQLRLSLTVQSFCKEITSFSAILGFTTVQPLACFVSSSSFRFFSMFARSSYSKIPFYHYLSSGLGYLAEGVCFPIVTDFASTGAFRLGSPEATLQGVGTILICKAIAKKIPAGNWILQHGAQSCALVSFDYGMEYVGLKEKENAGVVERLCFSELVAFRMSASAELLGIACPEFSSFRARQQLNYELNLPRKDSSIFRPKKNFFQEGGWEPKLVSANGAESPTLPEYADHSSLPWNRKGSGMVNMSSDFSERARRIAIIKERREAAASVAKQVLDHPHLVEFRRYNDAIRKVIVESWKAFHESGQPSNVAYYKDFAKRFLESHSFLQGIESVEVKAAKIKEIVNIGSLCFEARHSFLDLPAPPVLIRMSADSERLPESRVLRSDVPIPSATPSISNKVKSQVDPSRARPPILRRKREKKNIPPPVQDKKLAVRTFDPLGLAPEFIKIDGTINWSRLFRKQPRMRQVSQLLTKVQKVDPQITAEAFVRSLNARFAPHISLSRSLYYQRDFYIGAEILPAVEKFPWLKNVSEEGARPCFAEALIFARGEEGWSRLEAEKRYSISEEDLIRIESGESPTVGQLLKFVKIHGAPFVRKLTEAAGYKTNHRFSHQDIQAISDLYRIPIDGVERTILTLFSEQLSPGYFHTEQLNNFDHAKMNKFKESPHSKGEFYFWVRNLKMGKGNRYVSTEEMASMIGREEDYWNYRENIFERPTISSLPEMIHDAHQAGISFQSIRSRFQEMGVATDSFVYFLSESMKGIDREYLKRISGTGASSIHELFSGRQEVLGVPLLLKVAEGLRKEIPNLSDDFETKLFKAGYPTIGNIAPEARENRFIFLDPKKLSKAFQLDLRAELYRKRMDLGMTRTELGNILSISDVMVGNYERLVVSDISDTLILQIGKFLGRDPLENYIRYRPAVLKLFELIDPNRGEAYPMTDEHYQSLISAQELREDRSNLRNELHQKMKAHHLNSLEDLSRHMDQVKESSKSDIDTALLLKKLSRIGVPIDFEEILFLKQCFPDLSVKRWYEHFNHAKLHYFLGRKDGQSINYDFPEGIRHWDQINSDYILAEINRRLDEAKSDEKKRMRDSIPEKYKKSIPARTITDEALMRISRALNIDRRLLFFYLEKETLRKSLELG